MALVTSGQIIGGSDGKTYALGRISLRMLADSEESEGAFALGEFAGGEGPWTVPHIHRQSEESFYVLAGTFTFTLGDTETEADTGSFILVPRGTRHVLSAGRGGGRLLTLWTPGGLEAMFKALSEMPTDSLRDPEIRKALSTRFDSVPV